MASWHDLPRLSGYMGEAAYTALPGYAAALHQAAGLDAPPFDSLRVAQAVGVAVQPVQTYEGNRGLLVPLRDGAYRIIVRADESPGAQRFTVAHELIELGLQIGCPTLVERSYHEVGVGRAKERFCEVGAAEILMPLSSLRRLLPSTGGGIEALPRLASLFGASLHAMLRRLVDAATTPCAGLIVCETRRHDMASPHCASRLHPTSGSSSSTVATLSATMPTLRVSSSCGGGGLVAAVPAGAPVPPDSVLVRCHRDSVALSAVEDLSLGRLQGRYRVEAICPGRGLTRHVYALIYPL